jgi:hypothetical protein
VSFSARPAPKDAAVTRLQHGHRAKGCGIDRSGRCRDGSGGAAIEGHVFRAKHDTPGIGTKIPADQVEQRRLAGAVGSENAQRLALGDRQRDAVGHLERAEALADIFQRKNGGHFFAGNVLLFW